MFLVNEAKRSSHRASDHQASRLPSDSPLEVFLKLHVCVVNI